MAGMSADIECSIADMDRGEGWKVAASAALAFVLLQPLLFLACS